MTPGETVATVRYPVHHIHTTSSLPWVPVSIVACFVLPAGWSLPSPLGRDLPSPRPLRSGLPPFPRSPGGLGGPPSSFRRGPGSGVRVCGLLRVVCFVRAQVVSLRFLMYSVLLFFILYVVLFFDLFENLRFRAYV